MSAVALTETQIPGLFIIDLDLREDARGWFKENWQRQKMVALGLPDFSPVQNNISHNSDVGVTRGLHAEPWDKYVSVGSGSIFGAWVDLRQGPSFGHTHIEEIGPGKAVFVPRGVANGFQTLSANTCYTYLVNDHWSETAQYTHVNLADPVLAIPWPIPLSKAITSQKDLDHPPLSSITPIPVDPVVIIGDGQLGIAVAEQCHSLGIPSKTITIDDLDITDECAVRSYGWGKPRAIINCAAYTAVDNAEQDDQRSVCWAVNATAVGMLARVANDAGCPFVHVSSDYVFDGRQPEHDEQEPLSPLGVYGQSKAAGDLAATLAKRHYVLRTSWLIGQGKNFVHTMCRLAEAGVDPAVVNDQFGRLTFTEDLAAAALHMISAQPAGGVYNLSNDGPTMSWADVARRTFELLGADPARVHDVSSEKYARGKQGLAPRPQNSTLCLDKIKATGFQPPVADQRLAAYVRSFSLIP